jgi:Protein of unknown function (DUF3108)
MHLPGATSVARAAMATALWCAFAASPAAAQQGSWQATYGVSLIGLPIGTAQVNAELDSARYKIDVQARLTGLAGMVTGGKCTPRMVAPS